MAVEWGRRVGWRVGYPFPVAVFEERYFSRWLYEDSRIVKAETKNKKLFTFKSKKAVVLYFRSAGKILIRPETYFVITTNVSSRAYKVRVILVAGFLALMWDPICTDKDVMGWAGEGLVWSSIPFEQIMGLAREDALSNLKSYSRT